jgi:hypothetical protein
MWIKQLWQSYRAWSTSSQRGRRPAQRRRTRPALELLEGRNLPSAYTAASVADLIADINAANFVGGSNTITLAAGKTFSVNVVNNATDGATGLPVIAANDDLTIVGNGDTIERNTAKGTPAFRLFDVAGGASLTLTDLTLQHGLAFGAGVSAVGGSIYSQGTLMLNGVTIQNSTALGSDGAPGNYASGGNGYRGESGLGGGVYIAGGTAVLSSVILTSDTAQGGNGGRGHGSTGSGGYSRPAFGGIGGDGLGGGLYVAGGAVTLTNTNVYANVAQGGGGGKGAAPGYNGPDGLGKGGGLYITTLATVDLDAITLAHITHNHASTSNNDIYGSYTLLS